MPDKAKMVPTGYKCSRCEQLTTTEHSQKDCIVALKAALSRKNRGSEWTTKPLKVAA